MGAQERMDRRASGQDRQSGSCRGRDLRRASARGGIRHAAEILSAYLPDHDAGLLVEAGDRLGNRAVFKRLGYLLAEMDTAPAVVAASLDRISAGFSLLDPTAPARGPYDRDWNLRINVSVGGEDAS